MSRRSHSSANIAPLKPPAKSGLLDHPAVRRWLPIAGLALLTLLFLWPALRGVYIWDDDQWLTANPAIITPGLFRYIWIPGRMPHFYPLIFTSYWLEFRLWGLGTVGPDGVLRGVGYHVDNLLLHLGSVLLIFSILKRLKLPGGTLGAWLSAAIFAIHPVNVESVAWVAERKNCLCGVFFFAALLYGLRFFRVTAEPPPGTVAQGKNPPQTKYRWGFYAAALLLFVSAMLSKTIAAPLPAVFLLLIWWRRGRIRRSEALLTLPFFALAAGLGALTIYIETQVVGSSGPEWQFSLLQRVLIAGSDFWFYLGKLFAPFPVMQVYPRFDIVAGIPVRNPVYYAAPAAFAALVAALFFLRKKISRGPLTAVLFFAGVLTPALGFFNFYTMLYTFVADHYQYLACIGIIVLAVETGLWMLRLAAERIPAAPGTTDRMRRRYYGAAAGTLGGGVILALGALAFIFAGFYQDGAQLWGFNLEHNPKSFIVLEELAGQEMQRQPPDVDAARDDLLAATRAAPNDWRAYSSLGTLSLYERDPSGTAKWFTEADALMPPSIRDGRAAFYKDRAKAIAAVTPGLNAAITPVDYGPHFQIGKCLADLGRWDQAIAEFKTDLRIYPGNLATYVCIGDCYFFEGNPADALRWYHRAIDLYPGYAEAWLEASLALLKLQRRAEAHDAFDRAQALDKHLRDHFPNQVAAYFAGSDAPIPAAARPAK